MAWSSEENLCRGVVPKYMVLASYAQTVAMQNFGIMNTYGGHTQVGMYAILIHYNYTVHFVNFLKSHSPPKTCLHKYP